MALSELSREGPGQSWLGGLEHMTAWEFSLWVLAWFLSRGEAQSFLCCAWPGVGKGEHLGHMLQGAAP